MLAWWLTWLAGSLTSALTGLLPEPTNPDALATLFSVRGIADGLTFLGAILAIFVVLRIQWRAEERAETRGKPPEAVAA